MARVYVRTTLNNILYTNASNDRILLKEPLQQVRKNFKDNNFFPQTPNLMRYISMFLLLLANGFVCSMLRERIHTKLNRKQYGR